MERKLVEPKIDFADSILDSFEFHKNGDLLMHVSAWNAKRIKIIFKDAIKFNFLPGTVIADFWEVKEPSTFLNEALTHFFEGLPKPQYKFFIIEDIEEVSFVKVVAEYAKAIFNWTLLVIDNKSVYGKDIKDLVNQIKDIIYINYVIVDHSDEFNLLVDSIIEKEGLSHINSEYGCLHEPAVVRNKMGIILKINKFLEIIPENIKFDKIDLFFEGNYPELRDPSINEVCKIIHSDLSIQIKNAKFFYIYTPFIEIENFIKENFILEKIEYNWLEQLSLQ